MSFDKIGKWEAFDVTKFWNSLIIWFRAWRKIKMGASGWDI
jgi:hypothetical protein